MQCWANVLPSIIVRSRRPLQKIPRTIHHWHRRWEPNKYTTNRHHTFMYNLLRARTYCNDYNHYDPYCISIWERIHKLSFGLVFREREKTAHVFQKLVSTHFGYKGRKKTGFRITEHHYEGRLKLYIFSRGNRNSDCFFPSFP